MKRILVLSLALAFIPGMSFAADKGTPEAFLAAIEKKLDEVKNRTVQNYRLVDGTPDPMMEAIIAEAQEKAAKEGGNTLLNAIEHARVNRFAANSFAGDTTTCVNNQVTTNNGVYYSVRDCATGYKASRSWVQTYMYGTGAYILLASSGNIDFGRAASGGDTFAIYFSPSNYASEFDWLINATN